MNMDRRDFLKAALGGSAAALVWGCSKLQLQPSRTSKETLTMPKRLLGKTGQRLSIIGMGGIVVMNAEPKQAARVVEDSIAQGVNYFDVAPTYGDAELKLGPALKPYRHQVFLACKTTQRRREGAEKELTASLKRLQTDHLDLYQLHAIKDVEKDVHAALGKGGAIEAFLAARDKGLVRYLGFTAHSPQAALAAMREFDFDTIMYPINFACHYVSNFEGEVLTEARKRNMGVIAIKAMARQRWPKDDPNRGKYAKCWYQPIDDPELARLALSWSFSQGVTAAIPPGEESLYRLALKLAGDCRPLSTAETSRLQTLAKRLNAIFP